MRSVLVWIVFGIIPEGPWPLRYIFMTCAFAAYFALVTYLSVLWRDIIDPACAAATQFIESVMVGKKTIAGVLLGFLTRGNSDSGSIDSEKRDVKVGNGAVQV